MAATYRATSDPDSAAFALEHEQKVTENRRLLNAHWEPAKNAGDNRDRSLEPSLSHCWEGKTWQLLKLLGGRGQDPETLSVKDNFAIAATLMILLLQGVDVGTPPSLCDKTW